MPDPRTPPAAVVFPLVEGRRSSTATAAAVLADAADAVDGTLATSVRDADAWRSRYADHLRRLLVATMSVPGAAAGVARAGLASLASRLVVLEGTDELALAAAVRRRPAAALRRRTIGGSAPVERILTVPYAGQHLNGAALHRQLDRWVASGTVEPSHAEAVGALVDDPGLLALESWSFALLGAGAEMAPTRQLLRWGATVHAVDVPDTALWSRLEAAAAGSAGRLVVPERADGRAGIDLLAELHLAREWLAGIEPEPAGSRLVLGNYVYADGSTFLRLAAAVDALGSALAATHPGLVHAVLATPTDVFAAPPEAVAMARRRWEERGLRHVLQGPLRVASRQRLYAPQYGTAGRASDGRELAVADCLVRAQGPNYALAKSVHRWRATAAWAGGGAVSVNVAPPTRTRSVLKNRALAAAYAGAGRFGVEVFAPETASALMAAVLAHDLHFPPSRALQPHDLLTQGANHGGLWRIAYEPRSVLGVAVGLGMLHRR